MMKRNQGILFFAILSLLFFTGCGVFTQHRTYNTPNGSVRVSGVSFFENQPEIINANAYLVESRGDYYKAMASKMSKGKNGIEFYCGIRNSNRRKTLYVVHPEYGVEIMIEPGESEIFATHERHKYVEGYFVGSKKTRKYKLRDSSKIEKGVKVDYGVSIY